MSFTYTADNGTLSTYDDKRHHQYKDIPRFVKDTLIIVRYLPYL